MTDDVKQIPANVGYDVERGWHTQSEDDDYLVRVSGSSSRKDDDTDGRTDIDIIDKKEHEKIHYSIDSNGETTMQHDWEKQ